jgi:hypothetical protein
LWLIKAWFSESTFVVKIATFAKPQTVDGITGVQKWTATAAPWDVGLEQQHRQNNCK